MYVDVEEMVERMRLEPITAAELASRVGLSRQGMYNILNGKSQPKPATLKRICEALNCTPKTLIITSDGPGTDHERFADVMVERYSRELDSYDVEAAALDYIGNWLAAQYSELTDNQYRAAKAEAEREGQEFAHYLKQLFVCFEMLGILNDTRTQAAEEAFNAFFEVLPSVIDGVIGNTGDEAES